MAIAAAITTAATIVMITFFFVQKRPLLVEVLAVVFVVVVEVFALMMPVPVGAKVISAASPERGCEKSMAAGLLTLIEYLNTRGERTVSTLAISIVRAPLGVSIRSESCVTSEMVPVTSSPLVS